MLAGPPKSKSHGAMINSAPWSKTSKAELPTVDMEGLVEDFILRHKTAKTSLRVVESVQRQVKSGFFIKYVIYLI